MPNTKPSALTQELLQDKYNIAAKSSYTNYSFFMGASNDNLEEVLKTDGKQVCGVKIFMGSSTGSMLVDNTEILDSLFKNVPLLIATHCEDEATIRRNAAFYKEQFGDQLDASYHPIIRNATGCLLSSSLAVDLAKKYNTRLHILHISTQDEIELFTNDIPLTQKRITAEVCVHHLYFDSSQYATLGNKIKCNPAIKEAFNKEALFQALLDNKLDIIATDHAPHTLEEKNRHFLEAPSGLPLVQHSLNVMMDFYDRGMISKERIIEKMCHAPAQCFNVESRGYLREGYFADVVLFDPSKKYTVTKDNVLYKCGWSPLEGKTFNGSIESTYVNGYKVYDQGQIAEAGNGMRCTFSNQ
jgi:dihydroorotase